MLKLSRIYWRKKNIFLFSSVCIFYYYEFDIIFVAVPIIKCPQFAISKDMNENIKSNIITTEWKGEKSRDKD